MQLTNLQVLNALQSLNILSQQKMPIRLAWKVNTAIRELDPFAKAVEEPMKEIRTRHAVRDHLGNFVEATDKDGNVIPNTIQIPNDKLSVVNEEIEELLNQTVEVHNVEFKLSEFPDTITLEPAALAGLTPLITEDTATELSLVK